MDPKVLLNEYVESKVMAVLILDVNGIVQYINKTYLDILELTKEQTLGKFIGDITPESRALIVTQTGKAIIGYNWTINGHNMIGVAIPILKDDTLIGCFSHSLFMDKWDAKDMVENLIFDLNMYKDEVSNLYSARFSFSDIIGQSPQIGDIKNLAQKTALHPSISVLITGESGTGKELFAQSIHRASIRSNLPFIRVNCAAIPENLLEAELFGYEEGAFTGAKKGGSPGKLELANGGTIFLDEIGEMSLAMQSKILVFLQEREFTRLGNHRPIRVNVRIIAATNRNLETMIEQNLFREDLYYRLNVLRLDIPPLRERGDDIILLAEYLVPKLNQELRTKVFGLADSARKVLRMYNWPGNIRELTNVLERAMILADMQNSVRITSRQLGFLKFKSNYAAESSSDRFRTQIREYEKKILTRALEENRFNKTKTARVLDVDLSWLYKKIKQYEINVEK
ncbi:MAG: sigma 54-interacting transcriptional regulator [Syntrophomonas sp.]